MCALWRGRRQRQGERDEGTKDERAKIEVASGAKHESKKGKKAMAKSSLSLVASLASSIFSSRGSSRLVLVNLFVNCSSCSRSPPAAAVGLVDE